MKSYLIEIKPTDIQKQKIHQNIGNCRVVYNLYLKKLITEIDNKEKKLSSGYTYSKYLNNVFLPNNPSYTWIKKASSKAIKQSIMNCDKALKRFWKEFKTNKSLKNRTKKLIASGKLKKEDIKLYHFKTFPNFKKRKDNIGIYLPKNNKTSFEIQRHRVKIPMLKWIRIKEYGYLPLDANIKSCSVSYKAGRYFISFLVEEKSTPIIYNFSDGIGVDLGIKELAIDSNGNFYKNINKGNKVKKIEKKLKRVQRSLSRKYINKKRGGETANKNILKTISNLQKIHFKLSNIRTEYIRSVVNSMVKSNPQFVTIEDLNIKGMMKNKHLSKAIAGQKWYYFTLFLKAQANKKGIQVRIVDRWYPSSKICNHCGSIKNNLKLKDRKYVCDCGYAEDRDLNAAFNLRDANEYKIAN